LELLAPVKVREMADAAYAKGRKDAIGAIHDFRQTTMDAHDEAEKRAAPTRVPTDRQMRARQTILQWIGDVPAKTLARPS